MSKISAVLAISKGEEMLANKCIESLSDFADEIIIFSLGSSYESKKYKVIKHEPVSHIELVRNKMIVVCKYEWIIILDPDEKLQKKLKARLTEIAKENSVAAVNIPRKNIFFGKWIAHTNWWPDRQLRFFKKDRITWPEKIHTYPLIDGKILNIDKKEQLAILHYGYDNLSQFIERQIRYSKVEAENLFNHGKSFNYFSLLYFPTRNFIVRYIKHLGFLDGFYGFVLSFLTSVFTFATWIQLKYIRESNV